MEYSRKINNIEDQNKYVNKSKIETIITFRNQQLLDLWVNEMQGQISDGMWENSSRTDWLWRNVWLQLGDRTKVEVTNRYRIGRKGFGMSSELWEVIGDRIMGENGFETEKEAKKAWREIAVAIANATETTEACEMARAFSTERKATENAQLDTLFSEWEELVGSHTESMNYNTSSYASVNFNEREVILLDGTTTRKTHSYLFLHIYSDSQGTLYHQIEYHGVKWRVPLGHLAEAFEAIKEFDNKMRF